MDFSGWHLKMVTDSEASLFHFQSLEGIWPSASCLNEPFGKPGLTLPKGQLEFV